MLTYEIVDAKEKDIDLLVSMRLVTILNEEMDKGLSVLERNKVHQSILKDVGEHFAEYKLLYYKNKVIGSYLLVPYLEGKMIDMLFLFEDYRRQGIGSFLIKQLKESTPTLYMWTYAKNKETLSFLHRLGFVREKEQGNTIIFKYNCISSILEEVMGDIKIGYKAKEGTYHFKMGSDFSDTYRLQNASDLLESKIGLCFDQVELERKLFQSMKVSFRTYFLLYDDKLLNKGHAFLVYKQNSFYYWFEHAWLSNKGIHEYNSKEELLHDIAKKFLQTIPNGKMDFLKLYQYDKPRSGISFNRFLSNVINGKRIKWN